MTVNRSSGGEIGTVLEVWASQPPPGPNRFFAQRLTEDEEPNPWTLMWTMWTGPSHRTSSSTFTAQILPRPGLARPKRDLMLSLYPPQIAFATTWALLHVLPGDPVQHF